MIRHQIAQPLYHMYKKANYLKDEYIIGNLKGISSQQGSQQHHGNFIRKYFIKKYENFLRICNPRIFTFAYKIPNTMNLEF